ncbi:MAG: ABC transporter permease [Alphaproteobacteria bacterium]
MRGWALAAAPAVWLGAFFLAPFLIVLKISLAQSVLAVPPYTALVGAGAAGPEFLGSLENYRLVLSDPFYWRAYLKSVQVAGLATLGAIIIGFPLALGIVRAPRAWRPVLLVAVVLPFWTSFLVRVYAWKVLLQRDGIINDILVWLGVVRAPVALLYSDMAVFLGLTYSYLPMMVLPITLALTRIDRDILAAASDLGAPPWAVLRFITVPLALPGVAAGAALVFIPALGEFIIPELLGGPSSGMIGKVLWTEFFSNRDWPLAAALGVVMLALVAISAAWLSAGNRLARFNRAGR